MVVPIIASVSMAANSTPTIQSMFSPIGGSVENQRHTM